MGIEEGYFHKNNTWELKNTFSQKKKKKQAPSQEFLRAGKVSTN